MKKTLLIISGGIEAVPGIRHAREMGLHVVVSDINSAAPGFKEANDTIIASTYDVEATVKAALRYHNEVRPFDGVMSIASDVPLTVASVAEALGLPGIPITSARLASDKLAMKEKFRSSGVPIPQFQQVESVSQLKEIVGQWGYPIVLKPVDSRGARGVLRVTHDVSLDWAFHYSQSFSLSERVMVEKFLSGPQLSTESVVWDEKIWTPGISDRNYEYLYTYAPHIIENGGELPTSLPKDMVEKVNEVLKSAAASMGIRRGTIKGDIIVTSDGPAVIELAPRLSGGYFCSHEIPLSTGVDFVGAAIKIALGQKPDPSTLLPRFYRGVAQRFLFPEPGRVVEIRGPDEVASLDYIKLFRIYVNLGDIIEPAQNHPGRAGVLIAVGRDRDEALSRAIDAVGRVHIETVPL